jgi:hypothetical protein
MDEQRAVELMAELGVSCQIGTETYESMLEHPTVKAFIDGEISMSQAIFVEEYLANGFSATEAAIAAKYAAFNRGGYARIASSVLKTPKIKALIARRIAERALSANEVIDRIRDVADGSIADVLNEDASFIDLGRAKDRGKLHLLKEVKFGDDGEIQVKLRDQDQALDRLARSLGVYEKDNRVNLPPEVLALLGLSSHELMARNDAYDHMEKEMEDEDADAAH